MSELYWHVKINALLQEIKRGIPVTNGAESNSWAIPDEFLPKVQDYTQQARTIIAEERSLLRSLFAPPDAGAEICHPLSGARGSLNATPDLSSLEQLLNSQQFPEVERSEAILRKTYWWLWRCLPEQIVEKWGKDTALLPADPVFPDSSLWSQASMTSAFAGAIAGYNDKGGDRPCLATFTFTPVQELIQASRKMRDLWAGSWLLHYLSAEICWKLAQKYGPDCILYPSLYQQPLIDYWLYQNYEFPVKPQPRSLLTAGFPNVLVLILPKERVTAAMQDARTTLLKIWSEIGQKVLYFLQGDRHWWKNEDIANSFTWKDWLSSQWQTYWTGIALGDETQCLRKKAIANDFSKWRDAQNQACGLAEGRGNEKSVIFELIQKHSPSEEIGVGCWWQETFHLVRTALDATKKARSWRIATAFGPRSTISGMGPVVRPGNERWISEGESQKYWQRQAGLFDGIEELNATETLKRCIGNKEFLKELLSIEEEKILSGAYPDLTAGVAGYLKFYQANPDGQNHLSHFEEACKEIQNYAHWMRSVVNEMREKWGIPYVDFPKSIADGSPQVITQYHSRLLNAGWLVEDADTPEIQKLEESYQDLLKRKNFDLASEQRKKIIDLRVKYRNEISSVINRFYPANNPANWYVLAAGDGDNMSEWLKGDKMLDLSQYVTAEQIQLSSNTSPSRENLDKYLKSKKPMSPATYNAWSRSLLDFSNKLMPYLTEERYAGRLIYCGGDDILAFTNLWEWDRWLWDVRQCFRGGKDPRHEFCPQGNYWQWDDTRKDSPNSLPKRPLFTLGSNATLSFGVAIAHHSVPLAIALENLRAAEKDAKKHQGVHRKDAVQIRVIFSSGNILKSTAKFMTFDAWQQLLQLNPDLEGALFEQAAQLWKQYPAPCEAAIIPWTQAFCTRRDALNDPELQPKFQKSLASFLELLWRNEQDNKREDEIQNWLKLAAFVLRNRKIKLGVVG